MNYLAHLYLAQDSDESIIGNLLGDFIKGSLENIENREIARGITTHRKVDLYTDRHEKIIESKRLISQKRKRFAGIIIDVSFDHFLSRNWSLYSESELKDFISDIYTTLTNHKNLLPPKLQMFLPRMIEEDWLGSYIHLDGIGLTLDRISRRIARRFKRGSVLHGAVEEIESNYTTLEENFKEFFPDVIKFVDEQG